MKLVVATRNAGKVRELQELVDGALEVTSLREHPEAPERTAGRPVPSAGIPAMACRLVPSVDPPAWGPGA